MEGSEEAKETEATLDSPGKDASRKNRTGSGKTKSLFNVDDLDNKRYQLEREKQKNAKILDELEQKLEYAKRVRQRRLEQMASYTAEFLGSKSAAERKDQDDSNKDKGMPSTLASRPLYEVKPRTLGRREAVLGTKKIVDRQLKQVEKKQAVMEKKVNEAQNTNQQMREKINGLRKEHLVYDKLFEKLEKEVESTKVKIEKIKKKVQDGYAERNRIRKEMQESADRLQELELEAKLEWRYQDKELAKSDAIIRNPNAFAENLEKDQGSQETEEFLKNQQQECLLSINHDRKTIDKLSETWKQFEEAIESIKDGTGYENIEDLIRQFEAYEDEKYSKVNAINRLMNDIESTESQIQSLKESHKQNEETNRNVIAMKQSERDELTAEIDDYRNKLKHQEESTKVVLKELECLLPRIHELFQSIDCGQLFEEVTDQQNFANGEVGINDSDANETSNWNIQRTAQQSPARKEERSQGSPSSDATSGRPRSSTMGMYFQSPALMDTITRGISTHNISEFVSILEQKSAEIIHKYAVLVATENDENANFAMEQLSRGTALRSSSLDDDDGGNEQTQQSLAQAFNKSLGNAKVALAPERGSGAMNETFATSTLLSSMIGTDMPRDDEESDQDEYTRPLSLEEMKTKASVLLNNPSFTVAKQASQAAASYLVKHQEERWGGNNVNRPHSSM